MARFTEEWMSNLLSKNNIVDVVSDYVSLTRKGSRYWASCPFHNERNASFTVTPDRDMFYCFSCKKGGNVINFIMEIEHLDYSGAVAFLADRAGIAMPEDVSDDNWAERKAYRKKLQEMMREAALYFNNNLRDEDGRPGLDYIRKRGLEKMISRFGLGYAKDSFQDLKNHLLEKGYTLREMMDAFLVRQNGGNTYDIFRNRVIIPIINQYGDVIAFGGRVIGDGEPKYLNSSDTVIFNKRYNLFGLNIIRKSRDLDSIILTEGYMDVIALSSAGISNSVASLGTSLTREQAKLIKRYSENVYISYDGDMPGLNAAVRAIDILEAEQINVKVVYLPDDLDPDDYIKQYGRDAYLERLKKAMNAIEYKLFRLKMDYDINDPDQLIRYTTMGAEIIKKLDNDVQKEYYIKYLSGETGISESSIASQVRKGSGLRTGTEDGSKKVEEAAGAADNEAILTALLLESPSIADEIDLDGDDFRKYGRIFSFIKNELKKGYLPSSAEIISGSFDDADSTEADYAELISVKPPEGTLNKKHYAHILALRMRISSVQKRLDEAKKDFASKDTGTRKQALIRVSELDRELRVLQEQLSRG